MNTKTKKRDQESGIYLYVIEFENEKFYTGITNNFERRIKEHRTGKSKKYVNENLPIKNVQKELLKTTNRSEAIKIETERTIQLIYKHGVEQVSGGYITGELQNRILKIKKYNDTKENDFRKTLEDYGNYIEVDSKNQAGIQNIIEIINDSYDRYVVEYRTEIICRVI